MNRGVCEAANKSAINASPSRSAVFSPSLLSLLSALFIPPPPHTHTLSPLSPAPQPPPSPSFSGSQLYKGERASERVRDSERASTLEAVNILYQLLPNADTLTSLTANYYFFMTQPGAITATSFFFFFFFAPHPCRSPRDCQKALLGWGGSLEEPRCRPPPHRPPRPRTLPDLGRRQTDRQDGGRTGWGGVGVGWRGTGKEVTERGKNGGRKDTRQTVALPLENDFFVAPQDVFVFACFFSSAPLTDREGM